MARKFLTPIDLNKLELRNAAFQNLGIPPNSPSTGQFYYDTSASPYVLKVWDGAAWVTVGNTEEEIEDIVSGLIAAGSGISVDYNDAGNTLTIANTGVTSLTGTANEVDVSASAGAVTVSLPSTINANTTGNAATASALQTARIISISGDASASASFDGTSNIDLVLNIDSNSAVSSITGTANEIDVSASVGAITISLPSTVHANLQGDVTGTLTKTVTGTNTSEIVRGNMADNDHFRILIGGTGTNNGYAELATADDGNEPIYVRQYTGVFSSVARTATILDGSGNTIFPGSVTASGGLVGDVTGNASTASTLQNSRTISLGGDLSGSASFNGGSDITINATLSADSIALGTDTTGDYVQSASAGTGISVSGSGEGAIVTITNTGVTSLTGTPNEVDVSASAGAVTISLPSTISADITGNAGTASTLQNSRTISLGGDLSGSASFNGGSDITITAAIGANSVALGTDTTGDYVQSVSAGTGISVSGTGEGATVTVSNTGVTSITGTANEVDVSASAGAVTVGLPNDVTITGSLTVSGALTVSGSATYVNTEIIELADNTIILNSNATGAASQNAGIEVERGDDPNVSILWSESSDIWTLTNDGTNYHAITRKYAVNVGNSASTQFTVTHSLGTRDVEVQVYDNSTYETVETDVSRTSTDVVTVTFATAPGTNAYRVVVIG